MSNQPEIKLCGIKTPEAIAAAVKAGVDYLGFVFYPNSPRVVSAEQAAELARLVPGSIRIVALFVNPEDMILEHVFSQMGPDMIQLHGKETPERVLEIRQNYGVPVIKAMPVGSKSDLDSASVYETVSDMLLFDARPPENVVSALPGGNGIAFDWNLLAQDQVRFNLPWMLSGGLNAENIAQAISIANPPAIDVSSGIEDRPGHKDPAMIAEFVTAVRNAADT